MKNEFIIIEETEEVIIARSKEWDEMNFMEKEASLEERMAEMERLEKLLLG